MHVFVNPSLSGTLKAELQQQLATDEFAGREPLTVVFRHDLSDADQKNAFQQADFVMGNPPAAWFAQSSPTLKFWQLDSAGFDGYKDVKTQATIANMGDYFARPCAETMVAGILALYRRIPELVLLQDRQEWVGAPIRNRMILLSQKHVIILGTGTIGQSVRQMMLGFNCPVQMLARTDPQAELHTPDDLKAALPNTDIVVNCLPGTAKGFFSAELVAAMKPGSIYANVGRGTTTDEKALINALQSGQLGGAVLDVTEREPLPTESPLWTLPNVLLTQHSGGGQPNEDAGKVALFLRNLKRYQSGKSVENVVTLDRGY